MVRVRVAAGVAMALLAVACGGADTARDEDGVLTEPQEISVFDLRVGDCFDDPDLGATSVETLWAMPCSAPHDNEIFLVFDLPDGPYPGSEVVEEGSDGRCLDAFEPFVGSDYFQSDLDFFTVTPTEVSWETVDDRTVYCVLFAVDLSKLTGSMENSER